MEGIWGGEEEEERARGGEGCVEMCKGTQRQKKNV